MGKPHGLRGEVTFDVKNVSKDTIHEMIIAELSNPSKPLAYLSNENRVDEDAGTDHLGEVSELDPGAGGARRPNPQPGDYGRY